MKKCEKIKIREIYYKYLLDDERWLDGNAEIEAVEENIAVLLQQLDEVVADACMEVLRPLHHLHREVLACFEAPEAEEVCLFEQCADTFEVGLVGS